MEQKHCKKWTKEEDEILFRHVKARPQNLHKCFIIVSELTGRTPTAVQARWYGKVSKILGNTCFFTASPNHISPNRKNGEGVASNAGIWRKLMNVIKSLIG